MKTPILYRNERGAVLVISLMFLVILGLLGTTAVVMTTTDTKIGSNYSAGQKAFFNADAGVNFAVREMETDLAGGSFSLPTTIGGTSTMAYSVPSGFNFSLSDVTMIATNSYSITSTGAGPDNAKAEITILFKRGAAISFAAFGDEKMEVKNSGQIYSYDSRTSTPATGMGNSSGQGDIGSNEWVVTKNASVIDGDGVFGAYADGSATTNGLFDTSDFSGDAPVDAGRIDPDPLGINSGGEYDPTTYSASNDNASAVPTSAIAGNVIGLGSSYSTSTMTLPGKSGGANYYVTAIDMKNSTNLIIDTTLGPVRLFMDNTGSAATDFKLNNSAAITVIPAGNEDQFGFFTNFTGSLDVKNSGDFNGLFYAPKADVIIHNSGNLNGAVWGKTVDIKNSGIVNYNTALADAYLSNDLTKTSWNDDRN